MNHFEVQLRIQDPSTGWCDGWRSYAPGGGIPHRYAEREEAVAVLEQRYTDLMVDFQQQFPTLEATMRVKEVQSD